MKLKLIPVLFSSFLKNEKKIQKIGPCNMCLNLDGDNYCHVLGQTMSHSHRNFYNMPDHDDQYYGCDKFEVNPNKRIKLL